MEAIGIICYTTAIIDLGLKKKSNNKIQWKQRQKTEFEIPNYNYAAPLKDTCMESPDYAACVQ